jgi:hypothetical protein
MKIFKTLFLKKYLLPLAALAWLTIAPIRPALACVMALPLVDLVLGLACARKAKRPITSSGMAQTINKILRYEAATLLAFSVETWLTGSWVPAVKAITGLIGMRELQSCLEHLDELGASPIFAKALDRIDPSRQDSPTPPGGPPSAP